VRLLEVELMNFVKLLSELLSNGHPILINQSEIFLLSLGTKEFSVGMNLLKDSRGGGWCLLITDPKVGSLLEAVRLKIEIIGNVPFEGELKRQFFVVLCCWLTLILNVLS
jgi:hypothetical protein